ncbi:ComF family protein [Deinococcus sp. Leaf326]|uniref:ComF family protein n=1 Tax=Deinococcus sp. Leaf326 TaxID=1736338 RepID=UPI0006F3FB4F|nr:ComF family protein [Deinococcus sp. Leaf326]KQQ99428.1 competence protein ComF [Deinococcus sp. Leaf326]
MSPDARSTLGDWLRALLPRPCPGCGAQLGTAAGLCAACRAALRVRTESHSPLSGRVTPHLLSCGPYQGVARRSVRALKYGGAREVAVPLGELLAAAVPPSWNVAAVVPVPLHPARQRERGYNQAELLARAIAHRLGVPCVPALERTRATAQQARQQVGDRQANLAGAFRVCGALPPGTVLLVDDVATTGSTLLACRDALLAAGPRELRYAVVAR